MKKIKFLKKAEKKCLVKGIIQWNACRLLIKAFKNVKMNGSLKLVKKREIFMKNANIECIKTIILKT